MPEKKMVMGQKETNSGAQILFIVPFTTRAFGYPFVTHSQVVSSSLLTKSIFAPAQGFGFAEKNVWECSLYVYRHIDYCLRVV